MSMKAADAALAGATTNAVPQRQGRSYLQSLPVVAAVIGVVLVAVPIVSTILRSFYAGAFGAEYLSEANFLLLLTNGRLHLAALNTLITGISVTVLSTALGIFLAWAVARTDMPGRRSFQVLNLVPFFLSPYVGAMAWQYLAAPHSGMLGAMFPFLKPLFQFVPITSIPGVIWVLTLFYTPYIYLFIIGPMRNMDGALEDAARVHGASFAYATRHITLPLLMPAILSGALIVFVTSAGLFDVPLVLTSESGIPTVPVQIFEAVSYPSDFGKAAALGTVMMLITIVFAVIQQRYLARRRFSVVSGKGNRPRTFHLTGGRRAAVLTAQCAYILCSSVLPVAAIVLLSLVPIWTGSKPSQFTLDNYRYVLFSFDLTRRAITNSLFLAVVGATLGTALGFLQAYCVVRRLSPLSRLLEPILSLPLGIPGIILGLGFLVFLIGTPLYATIWIILIAYIAHYTPFALRGMSAMLMALSPELEQSARASGATWWQTVRLILIPLARPAMVAIWLMLFVIFIRELGASILLWANGTETLSVVLVTLSEQNFLYVAALAVIQLALLLSALVLFSRNGATILEH